MEDTESTQSSVPAGAIITPEKAELIERCTAAYLSYTLECYDRAKADGNNVLQWLFGTVAGGMGIIGPIAMAGHWWLAIALCFPVGRAAFLACKLIPHLGAQDTMPPGNFAKSLNSMLDDTAERMRWREAWAQDDRIRTNNKAVTAITTAVDAARKGFAQLPLWLPVPAAICAAIQFVRP